MSHDVSLIDPFPRDIALYMVSTFFRARQIVSLHQVSTAWNQIINQVATNAQALLGIRFEAVLLTEESLVEQWGELTSDEAQALRIQLNGHFPSFYSELRPATIMLDRRFLKIRDFKFNDQQTQLGRLSEMLTREREPQGLRIQEAMIVCRRIVDPFIWERAMHQLIEFASLKKALPITKLLEMTKKLPNTLIKTRLLYHLALSTPPSLKDLLKFVNSLLDPIKLKIFRCIWNEEFVHGAWLQLNQDNDGKNINTKDDFLSYVALCCDWEADGDAEKIAELIQDPEIQQETKAQLLTKKTNRLELTEKPFVEEKKSSE